MARQKFLRLRLDGDSPDHYSQFLWEVMHRLGWSPKGGAGAWMQLSKQLATPPNYAHMAVGDGSFERSFPALPVGWKFQDGAITDGFARIHVGRPEQEKVPKGSCIQITVRNPADLAFAQLSVLGALVGMPGFWLSELLVGTEDVPA